MLGGGPLERHLIGDEHDIIAQDHSRGGTKDGFVLHIDRYFCLLVRFKTMDTYLKPHVPHLLC